MILILLAFVFIFLLYAVGMDWELHGRYEEVEE